MPGMARLATSCLVAAALFAPSLADAAPRWVDRPITLPRLVFAGDVGLGIGHARVPGPAADVTGPGLNLEGAIGVTDRVELGLRTGMRFGSDAEVLAADAYGRTLWTETWGVGRDAFANPEARVRWAAVRGPIFELALDGRLYLPFEDGTRAGVMFGVPMAIHLGDIARIDTGAYVPVVFSGEPFTAISVPGYFWFQPSERLWLGPMTSLRFVDPGPGGRETELLVGFGLGYQVASAVDLKTMVLFPRVNRDQGASDFGVGFGVQFRIGD